MIRIIIVGVLIAVAAAAVPVEKASAHRGTYRVAAGSLGLNIRTGPGGDFRRLYTMPNGTLVKARGHRGSWLYGTDLSTGTTGWMWLAYMQPVTGGGGSGGGTPSLTLCWDSSFGVVYCAPYWIAETIYNAAIRWGVPYWALMGISSCESGYDPYVVNYAGGAYDPPSGIFQIRPSTMAWIYGGSVFSVYDSANAAGKLLAYNYSYMFDCAWRIGY